jgi:hypothetical protein
MRTSVVLTQEVRHTVGGEAALLSARLRLEMSPRFQACPVHGRSVAQQLVSCEPIDRVPASQLLLLTWLNLFMATSSMHHN